MAEAAQAALADAGIERPDAIVVAAMNPEEFTGRRQLRLAVATHLGLRHVPGDAGGDRDLVRGRRVLRGLRRDRGRPAPLRARGGRREDDPPADAARLRDHRPLHRSATSARYGTTMPALAGLITRAVMHRRGLSLREISQVAVKNHAHGARNPLRPLPAGGDARGGDGEPAWWPIRCASSTAVRSPTARAAVVLTLRPARRCAWPASGRGRTRIAVRYRTRADHVPRHAGRRGEAAIAWPASGPSAVEVAEIHDAFAPFELISLEDTGLVPRGQGGAGDPRRRDRARRAAAREPLRRAQGARPPARRHRHRPDRRAASGSSPAGPTAARWQARVALAQSIGGLATNNWVTLLEARR